jgi:hypothetical protein
MEQAALKNKKNQKDSWWRRALQIAIILMATSCGFVLRVNFLEKSS